MAKCTHLLLAASLLLVGHAVVAAQPAAMQAPASGNAQASANSDLEKFCQTAHCRRDVTVRLRKPDGTVFEQHTALMPPAVQRGLIGALPGETVRFVPILVDGKFHGWREPAALDAPDTPVFTLHLEQMDDKPGMMARIGNSGTRVAKLKLGIVTLNSDRPHPTSSCPVQPQAGGFETWPEPIFMLLVSQLDFVDDGTTVCD